MNALPHDQQVEPPRLSREEKRHALELLEAAALNTAQTAEAKIAELREPGEDDEEPEELADKPRTLLDHALQLSVRSIRATPPPRRFLLRDANTGAGRFIRGATGFLAAPGGSGKSYALMQLAVSISTGATWFGPRGWAPEKPGRVLALFGEEDQVELERRLHFCAREAAMTSDDDLELLARNLTAIPLFGHGVALTGKSDGNGELPRTAFYWAVHEMLTQAVKEGRPYDLIILDPLSRFGGKGIEKDNDDATEWVQTAESLTLAECGGSSMMVAHHTKKKGENDDPDSADLIRGASALVNGVRWAARLEQQKRQEGAADLLTLRTVKGNGIPPQMSPLVLVRDQENEGALRVATGDEIESNELVADKLRSHARELGDLGDLVVEALRGGITISRSDLFRKIGGNRKALFDVISQMVKDGEIEAIGSGRKAAVRLSVPSVPAVGTEAG